MILWEKKLWYFLKKIWYYTENYGSLIYNGKNYGTMEKLWNYSKLYIKYIKSSCLPTSEPYVLHWDYKSLLLTLNHTIAFL